MLNTLKLRIKIQIVFIITILIFLSFQHSNLVRADEGDSIPPQISNIVLIVSDPMDTQSEFGWENITCIVADNENVDKVLLNITCPDSTTINVTMNKQSDIDIYYYNTTFSQHGTYNYFIWANDTDNNPVLSNIYNFLILPNWDINNDGHCKVDDLLLISNDYGLTGTPGWIREDVDNNGAIQVNDINLLSNYYGESIYLIRNSKGNTWPASGEYIQVALDNLNGSGEVWLPEGTFDVCSNIYISHSGTKIHGQGYDMTTIVFHNSKLISSKNPYPNNDTARFTTGLDDIQLDNFKFIGDGNLELTLGNDTKIINIKAENTTFDRPGAIRFVIPSGTKHANGLTVTDCHTYKTHRHGFFINAISPYCTIENVTFSNCSARYAGWPFPAEHPWSVGFHMCEYYDTTEHGDMTIKNVLLNSCTAEYNWESGFHFECSPDKINVTLQNCLAQYNGQKRYYYNESYVYCSGFMGLQKDITLIDCIANYNTHYGYLRSSYPGFPHAVFINCTGTGNWDGLGKIL